MKKKKLKHKHLTATEHNVIYIIQIYVFNDIKENINRQFMINLIVISAFTLFQRIYLLLNCTD